MKRLRFLPNGIIARLFAIFLVTLVVEFTISTIIYEQASEFSVRNDEARRLAEHLVIARSLIAEQPYDQRRAMAVELTTARYFVQWSANRPVLPSNGESRDGIREQIVAWEPTLAQTNLQAQTLPHSGSTIAVGSLQLPQGDWLFFRTVEPLQTTSAIYGRIFSSVMTLLALVILGGLFIRHTLKPVRLLTETVEQFGPGLDRASTAKAPKGSGDVQRLMEAFNAMQERIRRLIDERTRALAAVSHDLRTPLARLRLRIEAVKDPALRREVEDDIEGMEAMVTSLLTFLGGDGEPESPRLIDLAVLCASIVDDFSDHGHEVGYRGPAHLEMRLRPIAIRRAVVNLVENAVHYGSDVELLLSAEGDAVLICVSDDGPGIPDESMMLVREPFVRLDHARQRDTSGFGLGLSIVERAVADEGGSLTLVNRTEGGLAATIRLPIAAKT
ncbi:ATP-binding protein [Sphingomonas sp. M1-B02]|uniref:ATP-binding protein n=1 Tax=Sphingomonas sp. M1-B02 TaxID=3114300 RepID=UPI00224054B5|nr:ATP-binding protein [Sphingomonas sp. S6-11]UZK66661.1 ATP-binding protein [Sphingomonas sp. S6-11]